MWHQLVNLRTHASNTGRHLSCDDVTHSVWPSYVRIRHCITIFYYICLCVIQVVHGLSGPTPSYSTSLQPDYLFCRPLFLLPPLCHEFVCVGSTQVVSMEVFHHPLRCFKWPPFVSLFGKGSVDSTYTLVIINILLIALSSLLEVFLIYFHLLADCTICFFFFFSINSSQ